MKCKGNNRLGNPCRNEAREGSNFCKWHEPEQTNHRSVIAWLLAFLGLGGLIGAYLWAVAQEFMPSPTELVCMARAQFITPAPDTHFTILVATLSDDPERKQTKRVISALRGSKGSEVLPTCEVLEIEEYVPQSEAENAAMTRGQDWLRNRDADLLIWGVVVKADTSLRIWFLSRERESQLDKRPYQLLPNLVELTNDFHTDLSSQLVAVALASIRPATEQKGTYLVEILKPVTDKLKHLVKYMPGGTSADQRGNLYHSLGLAVEVIGKQSGEIKWLEEAVANYNLALKERYRKRVPMDWATTQNNLGTALVALGERESGTVRLEEAVATYRLALEERTRVRVPMDWATTQNNLGTALVALGERESVRASP